MHTSPSGMLPTRCYNIVTGKHLVLTMLSQMSFALYNIPLSLNEVLPTSSLLQKTEEPQTHLNASLIIP